MKKTQAVVTEISLEAEGRWRIGLEVTAPLGARDFQADFLPDLGAQPMTVAKLFPYAPRWLVVTVSGPPLVQLGDCFPVRVTA